MSLNLDYGNYPLDPPMFEPYISIRQSDGGVGVYAEKSFEAGETVGVTTRFPAGGVGSNLPIALGMHLIQLVGEEADGAEDPKVNCTLWDDGRVKATKSIRKGGELFLARA